jgi:signal transduction histidine kinase
MPGSGKPFVPVGWPRQSQPTDTPDQRVGLHLLEALDSLDAIYGSAAFFAGVAAEEAIGDYTLDRCLESVHRVCGAICLTAGGDLRVHAERNGASALLRPDLLTVGATLARAAFYNGDEAREWLRAEVPTQNVLLCPIHVGRRQLGFVVILSERDDLFATGDVKLIAAVMSQAAIALSRAEHHRDVEIERRKLSQIIQTHSDGIVVLDKDGKTTLCNPIARDQLGTENVLELLQSLDGTCTLEELVQSDVEREVTISVDGHTRVIGITSRDIRARTGECVNVILTLRDLTSLRREDRLKRDFLSLLSHKFRTPLTALMCGLDILQTAEGPDREYFVQEVGRRTRDLQVLVDRMLYFAELLEGSWSKRGTTHLGDLREDVRRQFRSQKGAAPIDIVWDLADDALEVPVPPSRLRVALINLVDNALKFGSPETPWVRIGSRRTGDGRITIEVEDHGPGIPARQREELFSSFHQIEEDFTGSVQGAGIGLAIVREITTHLGGTLELRDALPHGCIFSLAFACQAEPSTPDEGRA